MVPRQVRQARRRDQRIADREGRRRSHRPCRHRAQGHRCHLCRQHERRLCAPGIPFLPAAADPPRPPLQAFDARRERLRHRLGGEKMTELNSAQAGEVLIKASYVAEEANIEAGFAGIFGKITSAYFQRYGDKSDALAKIAVKAHKNGAKNPYAHFQKEFAYEFCRTPSDKNPFVAGPLKRTDCSPVTDGAAAVVLTDVSTALGLKQAIAFRAAEHVNDFLPMSKRDIVKFEGPQLAWKKALASARLDLLDLSFVESHDCFTSAELIEYEAMGLT